MKEGDGRVRLRWLVKGLGEVEKEEGNGFNLLLVSSLKPV